MASVVALGSGLVGQFVIERLLEADHKVIVIDLQIPKALHQHPRVEARQGDAIQAVSRLPPQQTVINMLPGRVGDMVPAPAGHHSHSPSPGRRQAR